jgi:hypothetical protein
VLNLHKLLCPFWFAIELIHNFNKVGL